MEKSENKRSLCDATELATSRSRKRETDRIRKKKKKSWQQGLEGREKSRRCVNLKREEGRN